jgi:hypothetical protein
LIPRLRRRRAPRTTTTMKNEGLARRVTIKRERRPYICQPHVPLLTLQRSYHHTEQRKPSMQQFFSTWNPKSSSSLSSPQE